MDRDRVKGYFSGTNYSATNAAPGGFQQPQNNMSFNQPIVSAQGDIVLQTEKPKKSKAPIILIVLVLLCGVGIGAYLLLNKDKGGEQVVSDDTVSGEVLDLTSDNYKEIAAMQRLLIRAKHGYTDAYGFFSENGKKTIDSVLEITSEFSASANNYDASLISDVSARESFIALRNAVSDDLPSYEKLVSVYNLFYDYVKNGYESTYGEKIKALNDSKIQKALDNLNAVVDDTNSYETSNIVVDLFDAVFEEDYPKVNYTDLMGKIIAGLKDEEEW